MAKKKVSTFHHQSTLPKLPVPELNETCSLYLESVKPLLSNAEFNNTAKAVQEFQKPGGIGQELQKRLVSRAQNTNTSWLIDWWNDYAYMSYRDPVVIWVSYFFAFEDDKLRRNPVSRAASLIRGAALFRDQLLEEKLEPETTRTHPLCMEQYKYLFNSTRIPTIPSDTTRNADPKTNNHVVVIRNNRFFTFDLKINGKNLSVADIEKQIAKIYALADKSGKGPAVGLLTTENRDVWTKTRQDLINFSTKNQVSLDLIERAAFVVCLDTEKPVTKEEISRACWHGNGENRFFDKSLQFIVFDNGKAGFNGEHSLMDATPTSRLCDWVLNEIALGRLDVGSPVSDLPAPQLVEFELSPSLLQNIETARENFNSLINTQELIVACFEGYGKNLVKKMKCSPDAYAQMAIQLAFYKMNGYVKAAYESATTRKFKHGRTETCRSVSVQSKEWVEAMENPNTPIKVKGELGRKAIAAQTGYMAKAVEGKGVDRHLLGLRLLLKPDESKPAIFTDPTYAKSSHWNLSTSQITSEHYQGYGWGEVVPDGWGVAYMVKDNSLHFNLVSKKLGAEHFRHYFYEALREMRVVFEATVPADKPKADKPKAKL